ncbi:MAG: hypothetical protein R3C40_02540 [Parvularculaceae bacterium]
MIAGIGLLGWHYAGWHGKEEPLEPPKTDPLKGITLTPSMKASAKYFWVVIALMLVQIALGATTALSGRRPGSLWLRPVAVFALYPDAQLAHITGDLGRIATAWLGAGLYIAPCRFRA